MDWITNNSMLMTQKGLDFVWQRQRVISENIANAETPGYKAKYITFEDELRLKLSGATQNKNRYKEVREAINSSRYALRRTDNESVRLDENSVNVDVENVELARAQIQYEYLLRQMNDQLSRLRTVIGGR